jgi:hypothetical protein
MQALAWWAIPIIATSVAIVWAIFAARPKGPADAHRTVAEHLAFRSALQAGHVRVQPGEAPDTQGPDTTAAGGGDQDREAPASPPSPDAQPGRPSPRPN